MLSPTDFSPTSASPFWVYGNDSTHELWYGILRIHNMPTCCLAKLGNLLCGNKHPGNKKYLFDLINQSANHIKSHACQIYQNQKIWFNEPMNKKQHQPALVHHAAEKMQNAKKTFPALLSHGKVSSQKKTIHLRVGQKKTR